MDNTITGPTLDAVWMDAHPPNQAFLRDRRGHDALSDKEVVELIKPIDNIGPETYNEIMGGSARGLARGFIPGGVRALFDVARRSNWRFVKRVPTTLQQLDSCLGEVVEASCPDQAKGPLQLFTLTTSHSVASQWAWTIMKHGT